MSEPDELLVQWVKAVDTMVGAEVPVTLTIGGTLVSGEMVSAGSYMAAITEKVASVFKQPDLNAEFANDYENYVAPDGTMEVRGETRYIHLRRVVFFPPGADASQHMKAAWWRGKISSVDGFSFGLATHGDQPEE